MSLEAPTTYVHELPEQDGRKRVLSYAVLGLPLDSNEAPEQYIIYHHGWPSCRYEAIALHDVSFNLKWRIIAVDRYGVGQSTVNPKGSFETWAQDIQHLMDTQHINHAIMIGTSGGGPFACACARYLPERTAALVTISAMLPTNDPNHADMRQQMHWANRLHSYVINNDLAHQASLYAALPAMLLMPYPSRLIAQLPDSISSTLCQVLTAVGWAEADRQLLQQRPQLMWQLLPDIMQQSVMQGVAGVAWDMRITSSKWSFELKDIHAPVVLVIHGSEDANLPPAFAERLAQQIPGAQLKVYPGEGHLSVLVNQAADILTTLAAALDTARQRRTAGGTSH